MSNRQTTSIFRKYFIPHEGNNYHPHILHTKRAVFYGGFFVALKALVIAFAVLIPTEAFLSPDVLAAQSRQIVTLVNNLRVGNGLKPLSDAVSLDASAQNRSDDMLALQYFSHNGSNGHGLTYFLNGAGYKYYIAGENLAMGFSSGQDVVDAWIKSPTHYANLIEKNYSETGIGISSGEYHGVPTVFVAEHFGLPIAAATPVATAPTAQAQGTTPSAQVSTLSNNGQVAGETVKENPITVPVVPVSPALTADATEIIGTPAVVVQEALAVVDVDSSLQWQADGTQTKVVAHVAVTGPVTSATVNINGFTMNLKENGTGLFTGSATLPEKPDDVFRVITAPSVHLTGANGAIANGFVEWVNPKIVSQTPWQKYIAANSWLSGSIPVFAVLKYIYMAALAFFFVALLINIFFEIKKQHPHVIAQTAGLIVILIVLIKI